MIWFTSPTHLMTLADEHGEHKIYLDAKVTLTINV